LLLEEFCDSTPDDFVEVFGLLEFFEVEVGPFNHLPVDSFVDTEIPCQVSFSVTNGIQGLLLRSSFVR
jgi:hypothetical protein